MTAAFHRLSVAVAVFICTVPVCGQLWQPQDAEGRAYLYRDAQKVAVSLGHTTTLTTSLSEI